MSERLSARALVVGAGGFIGARLVRSLLASGMDVIGVVRRSGPSQRLVDVADDIEVIAADISEAGSIERAVKRSRPDVVVNLATPHGHPRTEQERRAHLVTSVIGTTQLVEALARTGPARLVHVGSSLEYGARPTAHSEDDRLAPTTPRGAAKAAATVVCLAWARTLGVQACVLRPFSVYGPGEDARRFVPTAIRAALKGTELPLTRPGLAHDFTYVDDVVEAIELALHIPDSVDGRVVNIATGRQVTNEELVALVQHIVGREVRTSAGTYPSSPHDSTTWVADVTLARELLGWQARTTLEEGLRLTVDSLRAATPAA